VAGVTDAELIAELMATTSALRRLARRRLADIVPGPRLPEAQRELLLVLDAQPGIGVAAAAGELHLAGNSVSTLVNALMDAGLLNREPDPDDRRAARLTLTRAARTRLATWRRARAELLSGAFDRTADGDREAIAAALPALRRLLGALQETTSTGSLR
jgi:DNA-binding MarR family transcriptional regulator